MQRSGVILLFLLLSSVLAFPQVGKKAAKPEAPPAPAIKVGDTAPDFKLLDQNGNIVSLSDFHGKKNVALAFYVFAFTGG